MQQTALNLLAISIFIVTLSCLLGPLFHIPPAIPASLTFFLLGLATLDTFGLQGKGVTLLLDGVARLSPIHRERIVHHEAGHFLVAYFLGIPITGYTLTAWEAMRKGQPGLGGVEFNTQSLEDSIQKPGEMRLVLDRYCTVWMAGIAAETMVYGSAEGGGEDKQKVREALTLFNYSDSESVQKEAWAKLQAKTLLEKYQSSYECLVEAMGRHASVSECYSLIQQHCSD